MYGKVDIEIVAGRDHLLSGEFSALMNQVVICGQGAPELSNEACIDVCGDAINFKQRGSLRALHGHKLTIRLAVPVVRKLPSGKALHTYIPALPNGTGLPTGKSTCPTEGGGR